MLISALLVLSSFAALAADGDPAPATPTNNITPDVSVSVTNLAPKDSVKFVKFIEWRDGEGWFYTEAFKTAAAAIKASDSAFALPELHTITGYKPATGDFVHGAISAEDGAKLARVAATMNATETKVVADDGTSVTYDAPKTGDEYTAAEKLAFSGLYCALVTPATADWLYNPIFVAADFSQDSTSPSTQAALTDKSYSPAALAKKEQVTLNKEVVEGENGTDDAWTGEPPTAGNTKYDVDIGDDIDFSITSKVPAFSGAYQNPVYEIHDNWEEGLAAPTNLVVKVGGTVMEKDTDYTYTPNETTRTFTVALKKTRLDAVAATGLAQDIEITYTSKITSLEDFNVTEKYNDAEVKFSNNPGDSSSYSLIEDKTRNYTFSIDASLLGYTGQSYWTDELIKTGLDETGNLLTTTQKYHSATKFTDLSPLQGAEFALFKSQPSEDDYLNHAKAEKSTKLYKNTVFNGFVTSDPNGRLNITGLDCGTYYLKEISAPAGYIKDTRLFTITIAAKYTTIQATYYYKNSGTQTPKDDKDILVNVNSYEVLDEYTVTVNDGNGNVVSTYDIVNDGPVNNRKVTKAEWEALEGEGDWAGDKVTPINNIRGTELPSTGGMGTTILYIGGSILVILAAVLLITKRRMNAED